MPITRRLVLAAAALALSSAAAPAIAADKVPVVASFSILGDFVRQVGGDRVAVTTLVGPNGDAHVYNPTPADAKAVANARLVVVNGLGFEGWMERLAKAAKSKAAVVVATTGITARQMADDDDAAAGGKPAGHDHGDHHHDGLDPHAWQSVANARIYVANIRDALAAADPTGKDAYAANAAAYLAKLDALDGDVRAAVAAVPEEKRKVITTHDAFGYFAAAYGVEFVAAQGVSTESEATPKQIAALVRQIKAEGIKAVFLENMTDKRLISRVAKETGISIGGELYADALSLPNGPAATYIDMIRHNVKLIAAAMAGV
jgi:zinc/manganese transport system substrate-binding protein